MSRIGIGFVALAATLGCKEQSAAPPPPPATPPAEPTPAPAPAPVEPPGRDRAAYGLAEGETFWSGEDKKDMVVVWTPKPGTEVELYMVRTKHAESDPHTGVLRARQGTNRQDLEAFTLGKGSPKLTLKPLANGRALFGYSPASDGGENNTSRVLLLAYDDKTDKVRVYKRWRGGAEQPVPAWAESGEFAVNADAVGTCEKVAKKIAACAKDPGFNDALFRRLQGPERATAEKGLMGTTKTWKGAKGLRQQCQDWASDKYEDTHLSDPTELAQLAKDADLDCKLFGRELDDEGGLPRAVAVADSAPAAK